jgi:hypothetical protein
MNEKKKIDTVLVPQANHTDREGEKDDSNSKDMITLKQD